MLHETGSTFDDENHKVDKLKVEELEPELTEEQQLLIDVQTEVASVMSIEREEYPDNRMAYEEVGADLIMLGQFSKLIGIFRGHLTINSEQAYDQLDTAFKDMNVLPIFRRDNNQDVIYVVLGRPQPATGGEWTALILFLITIFTVLTAGTAMALSEMEANNPQSTEAITSIFTELWRGAPYAVSILLILGSHELGHYFMSRYHGVAASLPYFLPSPLGIFGTFGAAIRLREPMKNRKILLDIGVAGPLAGLVFAIPILLVGLATSPVQTVSGGMVEGNSILYALAKVITFGRFLPSGGEDVFVNQLAWAGWTGLFVTGLNLIPLGQLDGGHVMYALIGKQARRLYFPVVTSLAAIVFLTNPAFMVILLLLIFLGRVHAVPLDDITPLDPRRRLVAIFALVIFVLAFVPIPLSEAQPSSQSQLPAEIGLSVLVMFTFLKTRQWRWMRRS